MSLNPHRRLAATVALDRSGAARAQPCPGCQCGRALWATRRVGADTGSSSDPAAAELALAEADGQGFNRAVVGVFGGLLLTLFGVVGLSTALGTSDGLAGTLALVALVVVAALGRRYRAAIDSQLAFRITGNGIAAGNAGSADSLRPHWRGR